MKKVLLAGLGNPGPKFEHTRHNLGIRVVQAWYEKASREAQSVTDWNDNIQIEASVAEVVVGDVKVICLFPLTFMNRSGWAIAAAMKKYGLMNNEDVLVVHDDIELPFGEMKFVEEGSAKGHNGIRSLFNVLGVQAVPRLRIGVGRPSEGMPTNEFVLAKFTEEEESQIEEAVIPRAIAVLGEQLQPS